MTPGPSVPDASVADVLRGDLLTSGFTVGQVEALLGPAATGALARDEPVPALVALTNVDAPAATLVRCFMLGQAVTPDALDVALPTFGAAAAVRAGLVASDGSALRATIDLQPHEVDGRGLWFASDPSELATGHRLRADHVLGVGEASTSLLRATVPVQPGQRVLDLGTGCGVQAIHAALSGATVTATDLSQRAVGFARFNAALNGVELDLRVGSLVEPVAGETFDLVVSNPPFVITPRADGVEVVEYRDGGMAGDDLVRDLLLSLGSVLAPGGVGQMLGNWEVRRGEHWSDRVGAWADRSGLDVWVVQRDLVDPAQYAELWLRDGGLTRDRDARLWEQTYRAWLADFAARDVEQIGMGMVTVRRPVAGPPTLRRVEELTGPVSGALGARTAAALDAWTAVGVPGPDVDPLLDARLVVGPDVTQEHHLVPGEADPRAIVLRQGQGYGRAVQVGTAVAGLVGACDGELTVQEIVQAIAVLLDRPVEAVSDEVLPTLRELLVDGLLTVG